MITSRHFDMKFHCVMEFAIFLIIRFLIVIEYTKNVVKVIFKKEQLITFIHLSNGNLVYLCCRTFMLNRYGCRQFGSRFTSGELQFHILNG